MDIFLAIIIFISVLVVGSTVWLLRWLKVNYPQSYNDPEMAGLGGLVGFMFASGMPSIQKPYGLLVLAIPIFIAISFRSASNLSIKLVYSGLSIAAVLVGAAAIFFGSAPSWIAEVLVATVFCTLWVTLFRWRYVHNQKINKP